MDGFVSARPSLEATGARAIIFGRLRFPRRCRSTSAPVLPRSRPARRAAFRKSSAFFGRYAVRSDALNRTIDVAALCRHGWRWRTIDLRTRRLDSIERRRATSTGSGTGPRPSTASLPSLTVPDAAAPDQPSFDAARRVPLKAETWSRRARPALCAGDRLPWASRSRRCRRRSMSSPPPRFGSAQA